MGSVDVSLWDLTRAYQKLNVSHLLKKEAREEMFTILSSSENRRLTFGTDSLLSFPFNVAVKTGTSKDMRDNWCVGFTKNYTVGVWVGNSSGNAMWNVSGITGAAPIFRSVFMALEGGTMKSNQLQIQMASFKNVEKIEDKKISTIKYPVNGEIIGFDLEIPSELQKLPIEINNLKDFHKMTINEIELQPTPNNHYYWDIKKGKHQLALKNDKNEILEVVNFEVR